MTSKIDADVQKALAEADLTVVAETDEYFIYSDGTLKPGPFGTRYSLMAATFDGERVPQADADYISNTTGTYINSGSTTARDPMALRAKADIFGRMATILAESAS